eukprot:2573194-Alexandrium_andersonii.AAC.1
MQLDLGRQPKVPGNALEAKAFVGSLNQPDEFGLAGAQCPGVPGTRPTLDQASSSHNTTAR